MTSMPLAVLGLVPRTSGATITDATITDALRNPDALRNAVDLTRNSERFPS
ncbi:hypothetical protein [Frankia gtarii]|uniref:hypothetical protein n=1 Tax=Frankia gtarii TaxID=2950102 RepID=UPI0021C1403D|nr:hypothetical protein [Frankia gtarii]